MASQPPNKAKASRWGSLLSGAVAGLESRLDTILAEDNEASARSRAQDKGTAQEKSSAEKPTALAVPSASTDTSRSPSRSRLNDRLQERLAKAVASQNPSRSSTPLNQPASPRSSLGSRQSADIPRPLPETKDETLSTPSAEVPVLDVSTPDTFVEPVPEPSAADPTPELIVTEPPPTLLTSGLPINPARISNDSQTRPSIDLNDEAQTEEKVEEEKVGDQEEGLDAASPKDASELNTELAQLRQENAEAEKQRQEEMLANLERIDALQAKLHYLAKETVAAAKEANSNSQATSQERKLAEKDERIALLMQEGEKLSKVEMRQGAAIKKMRLKTQQNEKAMADLRKRLARLEDSESDLKQRLKRSEQIEKQSAEQLKRYSHLEKDLEIHRSELASSNATVASLRSQLLEAERKAEEAENKAKESVVQADTNNLSAIQEQLEDAKLEKKLADDKWSAEVKRITEEARQQRQQASFRESELTNEISVSSYRGQSRLVSGAYMRYRITKAVSKHFVSALKKHLRM